MIDITEQMLDFKEAIRHIWNTYFVASANPMSPETQEAFSRTERALLRVIVLAPHGLGDLAESYRLRVFANILIKPARSLPELPIQFGNKESNGGMIWDLETMLKTDKNTQFGFFDFFDWNPYGHVDLPFVRGRELSQTDENPPGGRIVLIEQVNCKFELDTNKTGP